MFVLVSVSQCLSCPSMLTSVAGGDSAWFYLTWWGWGISDLVLVTMAMMRNIWYDCCCESALLGNEGGHTNLHLPHLPPFRFSLQRIYKLQFTQYQLYFALQCSIDHWTLAACTVNIVNIALNHCTAYICCLYTLHNVYTLHTVSHWKQNTTLN